MKVPTDLSDGDLLQSMLAGDEEAFAALYRGHQQAVYRFAVQMSGSRTVAEDVTQEVFMMLMRDGHTFDPSRGSLKAFLMGVARNHVLRRLRRERFYVAMEAESGNSVDEDQNSLIATGPLDDLTRAERIESVRRTVLALPEKYREVVVLCDLEEISYAEAAQVLGCAVGTVRSRLHRGRALMIEKLRPEREEETASATPKSARCFA